MPIELIELLLAQINYHIRVVDGDWTWQQDYEAGTLIVHGATPYTREQAVEDALRNALGLDAYSDELEARRMQ